MTSEDRAKLQHKINALLAKSQSTAALGNDEEAAAFATKAWELAARYGLTPGQKQDTAAIISRQVRLRAPLGKPQAILLNVVAQSLGCLTVAHGTYYDNGKVVSSKLLDGGKGLKEYGWIVTIFGREDLVDATVLLFTQLYINCTTQLKRNGRTSKAYDRSFVSGYATRIDERLRETMTQIEDDSPGSGLVLMDARSLAQQLVDKTVGKTVVKRTSFSGAGRVDGIAAADQADIGQKRFDGRKALNA